MIERKAEVRSIERGEKRENFGLGLVGAMTKKLINHASSESDVQDAQS